MSSKTFLMAAKPPFDFNPFENMSKPDCFVQTIMDMCEQAAVQYTLE